MHIAVGYDHRGFNIRQAVIKAITDAGHSYEDFGSNTAEPVDYPDIAVKVAEAVAAGRFERGILICGTGIGMCMAANKIGGIRAALSHNAFSACRARQHNDANAIALCALREATSPPFVVNVTGPEQLSVRQVCEDFARLFQKPVGFRGEEAADALFS